MQGRAAGGAEERAVKVGKGEIEKTGGARVQEKEGGEGGVRVCV